MPMSRSKGKGLDTCYSATYMSQTRDQQRFIISEVAADWHEPMVPQRFLTRREHAVSRKLIAALIPIHGLLSFLADVYGFFNLASSDEGLWSFLT